MWLPVILLVFLNWHTTNAGWPDPAAKTSGRIWPHPQTVDYKKDTWTVNSGFDIITTSECDIVINAVARYKKHISRQPYKSTKGASSQQIKKLTVLVENCPGFPSLGMDESYQLFANESAATLRATEAWGVLRGLESFAQLFYSKDGETFFQPATIDDFPRFPHRGLLLDTSRHYFPIDVIKAFIDLLAINKMNVFHWHMVDSEAFPYVSKAYPELAKGAYSPKHVYTSEIIKEVLKFARSRGVRVIPEFDTPGHVSSWGYGMEEVTSRCFNVDGTELHDRRERGMLNVASPKAWDVLSALFKELFNLFPEKYFHLGGDETEFWMDKCWANNKNISDLMKAWEIKSVEKLEQWYFDKLLLHLSERDIPEKNFIVWQEVLDMGIKLPRNVVGHVWKGNDYKTQMDTMKSVVEQGRFAILSSCWYLDHISWNIDYMDFYKCDPQGFNTNATNYNLVLGGEAAMWGEMVDSTNAIARTFPRASAVAEKLWSHQNFTAQEPVKAWPRLYEMQCRMVSRGYPTQPGNGPGFCEEEYKPNLPNLDL